MQSCDGFAEAALRHYLILPTHHPQWMARQPVRTLRAENAASAPAPTAACLFDKSGSTLGVGCMWYAPRNAGERTTDVLSWKRDKKA